MPKYPIDINEFTLEQLPSESCQTIAYAIGMDNLFKLAEAIGGTTFYLPTARCLFKAARDKSIVKEFDGGNYAALAKKYEVSDRWIRKILEQSKLIQRNNTHK